jgi:hypothetical protein
MNTDGTETRKIRLTEKHKLGLENREGDILVGRGDDGQCYLIAEVSTYYCPEVIEGMGSVHPIEPHTFFVRAKVGSKHCGISAPVGCFRRRVRPETERSEA